MGTTNIEVTDETWRALNRLKRDSSDTFDQVIRREADLDLEAEPEAEA
jgi:predicted CopG family antitoxin